MLLASLPESNLVQLRVMLVNVAAVDIQHLCLHIAHSFEFLDVIWSSRKLIVAAFHVDFALWHKDADELLELLLNKVCLDVGSPEHLSLRSLAASLNVVQLG